MATGATKFLILFLTENVLNLIPFLHANLLCRMLRMLPSRTEHNARDLDLQLCSFKGLHGMGTLSGACHRI